MSVAEREPPFTEAVIVALNDEVSVTGVVVPVAKV